MSDLLKPIAPFVVLGLSPSDEEDDILFLRSD